MITSPFDEIKDQITNEETARRRAGGTWVYFPVWDEKEARNRRIVDSIRALEPVKEIARREKVSISSVKRLKNKVFKGS